MSQSTQVLVVGAGPGGYVAAIKLGQLGKKVLLVDRDKLGGECLNYGCIPSKALIHAAGLPNKLKKLPTDTAKVTPDWSKVQTWKNQLIGGFQRGIAGLTKGNGVTVMTGEVKFTSATEAEIKTAEGAETVTFEQALITTGTRPIEIPEFKFDGTDCISSKEALDLQTPPKELVIIGGGVIGLEIGTFFAKLGSKVKVVEMTDTLLPGVPTDLVAPVSRNLQRMGVEVLLNAKAKGFSGENGALSVTVETAEGEKTLSADKVLVSVGRMPVTQELGLEAAGIKTDSRGHILVDGESRTNVANIYAAGDVAGAPYLAHKASRQGILAAFAIAGQPKRDFGAVPSAIFTDPEIAFVGETEADAKARGVEIITGRFPFSASGRAQAGRDAEGFVKVIAEKESHKIIGTGIVGPSASDLISEACLAVKVGATIEDVADTIHPHPTLPEAFQEAAEACLGKAIHILQAAGR